jgi:uncharacterized protein YacL
MMGRAAGAMNPALPSATQSGQNVAASIVNQSQVKQAKTMSATHKGVWALAVVFVLYLVWAFASKHQKVQESLKPSNIEVNLYNLLIIWLAVVVSVPLSKVLLVKLAAWHVPGAKTLLAVVGNA